MPTTMGCAEFSRGGGGITDHQLGRKLILAGDGVTHRTVIIDGQALATTPLRILVSTAIGQLRIAIETVYSTGRNPIGDGMALHAIRLLFEHLPPNKEALCLACADLDHLLFLPAGDAALTRRARKYSTLSALVLQWSRARKRYERQGLLVEEPALVQAEADCLADSEVRARRRERAAAHEEELDRHYVERFSAQVRMLFPGCPPGRERVIGEHACQKYSGRVGRSAAAKALDEQAVRLAVIAHIRHAETPYDALLARGDERGLARAQVEPAVTRVLRQLDVVSMVKAPQEPEKVAERQRIFGDLTAVEGSPNDLYALARDMVASGRTRPQLYQCCGAEDVLHANNMQAKTYFQSLGLELTYEDGTGEHEWGYWDQQIQRVLAWLPLETITK